MCLQKSVDIIWTSLADMPGTNVAEQVIHRANTAPIRQRCYRQTTIVKNENEQLVAEMLNLTSRRKIIALGVAKWFLFI